jgi:hypothetical protein
MSVAQVGDVWTGQRSGKLVRMSAWTEGLDRPRLTLTPLGPGGRPLARWRWAATLLALAALVATVAVLLSARAPEVFDDVSTRVSARLGERAPEAREAAERAVRRTGVEESDALAHIGLWAAATVLAGLATWSWTSLSAAVVLLLAGSTGLEVAQERLSPTRITEWSDLAANVVGIGLGLGVVLAVTTMVGLPARARRRRWRHQPHP